MARLLCPTCVSNPHIGEDVETIQAPSRVTVDYGGGSIRLHRERSAIVVAPNEVRHLVDALVEAGVPMAERQSQDTSWRSPPPHRRARQIASERIK
jgi:hypothetical protein